MHVEFLGHVAQTKSPGATHPRWMCVCEFLLFFRVLALPSGLKGFFPKVGYLLFVEN